MPAPDNEAIDKVIASVSTKPARVLVIKVPACPKKSLPNFETSKITANKAVNFRAGMKLKGLS